MRLIHIGEYFYLLISMKRVFLVIASVLVMATSAFAQDIFYPGFQLGLKGGAAYTSGEAEFTKLISPAAALDLGYQISPVFGLRADISGWQGKGWNVLDKAGYNFNFAQLALDATFDICNLFGYKERILNPYVFLGVGGVGYLKNGAVNNEYFAKYWDPIKINTVARAGLGVDIRLTDLLAIEVEAVENFHSDKFNSKKGSYALETDQQINLLAGLKFNFGAAAGKKKAAEAAAAAAAAAAAQAAAAQARADKELADAIEAAKKAIENAKKALEENDFIPEDVAAINDAIKALQDAIAAKDLDAIKAGTQALNDAVENARKNKKAADDEAAAKAAEEDAAAKAAAEAARAQALQDAIDAAKKSSNVVYYVIGKYDIRNQERYKINNLLKKLKKDPNTKAVLCSFADKETGTPDGNWVLSENRSNIVKEALEAAGIDPSRIETYWYGDTERISRIPEKNRATVLLAK